jgi:hypothetical protein
MWAVLVVLGGGVATCILLFLRGGETESVGSIALLAGAPIPFAALPNIWAYAGSWTMSDFFLVLWVFLQISIGVLGVMVIRQIRQWRHS